MKRIQMKGKNVEEAIDAAIKVLGGSKENVNIRILSEGKAGMLGIIGGEEAEVEVALKEGIADDAKQILQEILDKMQFVAIVEIKETIENPDPDEPKRIELNIKGDDMGRIIGKEGATLQALETIVSIAVNKVHGERVRIGIDAGDYKEKRQNALERLAKDAAAEVASSNREKVLPPMTAGDRRIIHLALKADKSVSTHSQGEGKERRLVISPR